MATGLVRRLAIVLSTSALLATASDATTTKHTDAASDSADSPSSLASLLDALEDADPHRASASSGAASPRDHPHSYAFRTASQTPEPAAAIVTPTPPPTTQAPTIAVETMSVDTSAATVKPADTAAPSAAHDEDGVASSAASSVASSTSGTCPEFNEITSDCGHVCPNNALCIKYRTSGECEHTDVSLCLHPQGEQCAYECLDGTSAQIDEWYISPFGVPAWDVKLHSNAQIEAVRMVNVPRNITQLSLQFLFTALNGTTVKGKVATLEFPDKRIVNADSTLASMALVNLDYRKIPALAYAPQLQYLVLQNCLLTEIPSAVLNLTQLNYLNLQSNSIAKISNSIVKLPLAALYLDDNEMTEVPTFTTQMSSLKALSFVSNKITKVTVSSPTSALQQLALDYNQLTDFAGVIPSLTSLFLRGNRLTAFPSTLPSLSNLQTLDLTENGFSSQSVEQSAANLTHPYLQELMLASNGLHSVPDLGNTFPVLQTLWMRNNSIETVEGVYSGKLTTLSAFSNKIKSFTASFTRLTTLDLSDNKLDALPDIASISPSLQVLNVSSNQLEKIKGSQALKTLTALNASSNSISSFSLPLPALRLLDLSKNKLTAIPSSVWTYSVLDELYLDGNSPLGDVQFSQDQYVFLQRLSAFTLDETAVRSDCPDAWKSTLHNMTVCVANGSDGSVTSTGGGTESHPWTWISLVLGTLAVIAVVAFVFVVRRRRHRYDKGHYEHGLSSGSLKAEDRTAGLTQSGLGGSSRSHANRGIWDDAELQECRVDYDSIKFESKLAAGAYGEVWIGTYRMECVAVKKLSDHGKRDKNALAYFVSEIKLLAQLDHPRIIRFYGVAWTSVTDLCAVIEYMPGGDLHSMLRTSLLPSNRWNAAKLQIALDTVEALTYVHTLDDVLIHRDLKSRNVLLDDDWRAKVTDFGISRFQREADATMTSGIGTGRWMAPEVIMGRADYNEKVDIYSFGVILSELDTHQMPYTVVQSGDPPLPHSEMGIMQMVAAGELRPSFSHTCPQSIADIGQKCLAFKSEDRPSALELAYWLRQLIPMFPREEAPRPSSIFSRGTFTLTAPFRKSTTTTTTTTATPWQSGAEIPPSTSSESGEFSL